MDIGVYPVRKELFSSTKLFYDVTPSAAHLPGAAVGR